MSINLYRGKFGGYNREYSKSPFELLEEILEKYCNSRSFEKLNKHKSVIIRNMRNGIGGLQGKVYPCDGLVIHVKPNYKDRKPSLTEGILKLEIDEALADVMGYRHESDEDLTLLYSYRVVMDGLDGISYENRLAPDTPCLVPDFRIEDEVRWASDMYVDDYILNPVIDDLLLWYDLDTLKRSADRFAYKYGDMRGPGVHNFWAYYRLLEERLKTSMKAS